MNNDTMLRLAVGFSVLCMMAGLALLPISERQAKSEARVQAVIDGAVAEEKSPTERMASWLRPLGMIGRAVMGSGLLSAKAVADLEKTLIASGHRSSGAVSLFVGGKILLFLGLPTFTFLFMKATGFAPIQPTLAIAISAVVGLLLPDYVVRSIRKKYLKQVEAGLPAALDLLIICAEAGLALEAGFERVSVEFQDGIKATATELRITANEMKVLSDRRQALLNMGTRTGLESMQRLGGMLAQSQKYGTPLSQALRVLAAEMRQTTLTRFEARAARLPVLLTVPMIIFILPCIFVVVAGPAAVQVMGLKK